MRRKVKKRRVKIDNFSGISIKITDADKVIKESCDNVVKELQGVRFERNRKGRNYSKGWKSAVLVSQKNTTGTVYNATDWQLTWLLENGHQIVNKKGGVGWAAPHPHIKPAYEHEKENFKKNMKEKACIEIDLTDNHWG